MKTFESYIKEEFKEPKFVYHLTLNKNEKSIRKHGLDPKKSKLDAIYISDDLYTAGFYAGKYEDEPCIICKIKFSSLDKKSILPDSEDYPVLLAQMDEEERAIVDEHSWEDSLKVCNQIKYIKVIPPKDIVEIVDYKK